MKLYNKGSENFVQFVRQGNRHGSYLFDKLFI